MSERVRIESQRFGVVEADAAELITFPGLPGFPSARRFLVRRHDRGDRFGWLLCADDPQLAFVVADPWELVPEYAPEIGPRWLRALGARSVDEIEVLVIARVGDREVTLNLAAPLLIEPRARRGVQAVLDRADLPTDAPVSAGP